MHDRLQLSAGARYDKVGQFVNNTEYTASQWTIRYGAVFKITQEIHVFALHNESFLPNSAAASAAFGYFLAPQKGKQNEAGVRLHLFDQRLLLEASYYDITSTNVVQSNPFGNVGVVPPIPANNYAIVPGVTNHGVDVDAKLNLSKNTQIIASYAHYNITNAAGPVQLATGITSFPVNNVPDDQLSLFAKYSPEIAAIKGLYFTGGYRYTGRRPAGAIGAVPALYLNGYGVVDAGMGYGIGRYSLSLMLRNAFNIYAFRTAPAYNRLYPEEPRALTVTLKIKL